MSFPVLEKVFTAKGAAAFFSIYTVGVLVAPDNNGDSVANRFKNQVYDYCGYQKRKITRVKDSIKFKVEHSATYDRFASRFQNDELHEPSELEMLAMDDGLHHVSNFLERHKHRWEVESSTMPNTPVLVEESQHFNSKGLHEKDQGQEMLSNTDLLTIAPQVRVMRNQVDYNGVIAARRIIGLFPRVTTDEVCTYLCDPEKRLTWDTNYRGFEELIELPPNGPGASALNKLTDANTGKSTVKDPSTDMLNTIKMYRDVSNECHIAEYPDCSVHKDNGSGGLFGRKVTKDEAAATAVLEKVDGAKMIPTEKLYLADVANEGIASMRTSKWVADPIEVAMHEDKKKAEMPAVQTLHREQKHREDAPPFVPQQRGWLFHRISSKLLDSFNIKPRLFLYERSIAKAECTVDDTIKVSGVDETTGERISIHPSVKSANAYSIQFRSLPPISAFVEHHNRTNDGDQQNDSAKEDGATPNSKIVDFLFTRQNDALTDALTDVCKTVLKRIYDAPKDKEVFMHYQEVLLLPLNGASRLDMLAKVACAQVSGGMYGGSAAHTLAPTTADQDAALQNANAPDDPVDAFRKKHEQYNCALPTYFFNTDDFSVIVTSDGKRIFNLKTLAEEVKRCDNTGDQKPDVWFRLLSVPGNGNREEQEAEYERQLTALGVPKNDKIRKHQFRQRHWLKGPIPGRRRFVAPNPAAQPLLDELSEFHNFEERAIVKSLSMLSQTSAFTNSGEFNSHGVLMCMTCVNDAAVPGSLPMYIQKQLQHFFTTQAYQMLLHGIGRHRQGSRERKFMQIKREQMGTGLSKDELAELNKTVEKDILRRKEKIEEKRRRNAFD